MEEKKNRTMDDITRDYSALATKGGDLSFKLASFQKDLDQVHEQMRTLNFEYVAARNLADKIAEQVAAEKAKPVEATVATKEEG